VALALRQWQSIGRDESLQFTARMSRELGVVWEAVPLLHWQKGVALARQQRVQRLKDLPEDVAALVLRESESSWGAMCGRLADEHPGLRAVAGLLAGDDAGLAIDLGTWPDTAHTANLANEMWNGIDAGLQRYLLRPHAIQADAEVWPEKMVPIPAKTLIKAREIHRALPSNLFWLNDIENKGKPNEKLDKRASVIHTPVLLALSVTTGFLANHVLAPERAAILHLHRSFDADWFMYAFDQAMRVCIYSGLVQPFSAVEVSA
jgi:hypothetical protein